MEQPGLEWMKFATDELEIMLPSTYIGGNPKKDKKAIEAAIDRAPEKYRPIYKAYFKGGASSLMAADTHVDESYDYITVVNVTYDKVPLMSYGINMEKYLKEGLGRLGKNVEIAEKGIIALQNYQAARVVMNSRENRGMFKKPGDVLQIVVVYTIRVTSRFWDFFFSTTPARFAKESLIFDQSMHSVEIKSK